MVHIVFVGPSGLIIVASKSFLVPFLHVYIQVLRPNVLASGGSSFIISPFVILSFPYLRISLESLGIGGCFQMAFCPFHFWFPRGDQAPLGVFSIKKVICSIHELSQHSRDSPHQYYIKEFLGHRPLRVLPMLFFPKHPVSCALYWTRRGRFQALILSLLTMRRYAAGRLLLLAMNWVRDCRPNSSKLSMEPGCKAPNYPLVTPLSVKEKA